MIEQDTKRDPEMEAALRALKFMETVCEIGIQKLRFTRWLVETGRLSD